jgi:hypothetical protein
MMAAWAAQAGGECLRIRGALKPSLITLGVCVFHYELMEMMARLDLLFLISLVVW